MSRSDDIPSSVRIRTGEGNEHRYRSIKKAGKLFDRNRSDSIAYACENICDLVESIEDVLEREDLTHEQRREIAETLSTRTLSFDVPELEVDVDVDG